MFFYSLKLSVIQLTVIENLTLVALSVPEILALKHDVAEDAAKHGPKKLSPKNSNILQ